MPNEQHKNERYPQDRQVKAKCCCENGKTPGEARLVRLDGRTKDSDRSYSVVDTGSEATSECGLFCGRRSCERPASNEVEEEHVGSGSQRTVSCNSQEPIKKASNSSTICYSERFRY
jgi:hypothetical protein